MFGRATITLGIDPHSSLYLFSLVSRLLLNSETGVTLISYLLLGEKASQSIGNTLRRVSTMFTHLAVTPPEVNRFG